MTKRRTYLDHNASTPLRPEARAIIAASLDVFGNPSSVHAEGRRARAIVDTAREEVAALVGARPADIIFTSGATEANAAVIHQPWSVIAAAPIEHPSVLAPIAARHVARIELPVGRDGVVAAEAVRTVLDAGARAATETTAPGLLALQFANSEIGTLQPLAAVTEIAHAQGFKVLSDAVQAAGRVAIDVSASGIDYMTLSAHKIGGPKGVGALIVRDGAPFSAFLIGGGQERRRRGGTENVAGIAGFGAAAVAAKRDCADMARLARLRDRLEAEIARATPDAIVISQSAPRLANTVSVALPGTAAETALIKFDLAGIAISAGAACSSGKVGPSLVMAALGLPSEVAGAAIRISFGWTSSEADITAFMEVWRSIASEPTERRKVA